MLKCNAVLIVENEAQKEVYTDLKRILVDIEAFIVHANYAPLFGVTHTEAHKGTGLFAGKVGEILSAKATPILVHADR